MTENDRKDFGQLIAATASLYGKTMTSALADMYFEAMKRFSIDDVRLAFNAHIQSPDDAGRFMPKPTDLIQLLQGNSQTTALQAWTKVDRAVRVVGNYRSVVFDDPIIHAVVEDMGGWTSLCNAGTEEELKFRSIEFAKRYQHFTVRGGVAEFPTHLKGLEELDRDERGLSAPTPVLLGDERKAALVAAQGSQTERLAITAGDKATRLLERAAVAVVEHKGRKALGNG